MKVLCKHCENKCKQIGKIECSKYLSISSKPERLVLEMKQAYKEGNHEKAKEIQMQLDYFYYGRKSYV